ncbi:xanthine dehydrogenase YagT iron-sulfur-binding subunit [Paraburkholderia sp. MM5482-R2]
MIVETGKELGMDDATFGEQLAPNGDAGLPWSSSVTVTMRVNGQPRAATVNPRVTLLDWLREDSGLSGAKKGCNEGACGTCTVLVDGKRMNSCLTLVVQCDGCEVTTVEGLAASDGTLHPVQRAFIEHDAFQCGYCTPGQIVSAVACIAEGHATDEASVREWMSGNLCRCSCYPQIAAAVLDAAGAAGDKR